MHRDLKLSYIRWCDKLGISTTTVANIEMVPRTLGVNSWKLPIPTTSTGWTKRWTGNIVGWNFHLRGELGEKWLPASSRWEESIDRIFMVVGWGITTPGGVGGSDWIGGCGRGNAYLIFVIFFTRAKFLENKIYTEKRQFFALNLSKTPLFREKSVENANFSR